MMIYKYITIVNSDLYIIHFGARQMFFITIGKVNGGRATTNI